MGVPENYHLVTHGWHGVTQEVGRDKNKVINDTHGSVWQLWCPSSQPFFFLMGHNKDAATSALGFCLGACPSPVPLHLESIRFSENPRT